MGKAGFTYASVFTGRMCASSSHPPRRGPSKHVPHDMRYYFRAASTPTATPNAAARTTVVDECRARPATDGGVAILPLATTVRAIFDLTNFMR